MTTVWDDIEALAGFLDAGAPRYTRRPFGPAYAEARAWLAGRMAAAGLDVHGDAAGNLVGRRAGAEALPPIVLGSHVDTVRGGGRFDGALGVLAAIEVVRALSAEPLRHPIEVVDFVAEEPTDYGPSTVGSRAWAGMLDETLLAARNADGETLAEALPRAGADLAHLAEARRESGSIAAYLELHIEQGDELERAGLDVAVVTGIVGIDRYTVVLDGEAAHSGTTPIRRRRDALAGAAEVVLGVEQEARAQPGKLVGTVGRLDVEPNAANVVPGRAELVLELRALGRDALEETAARVRALVEDLCARRGLGVETSLLSRVPPAHADPDVLEALERGCAAAGRSCTRLPSWAGHDASQIAQIAPFGMLFAPSRGGVSHHPDEWTSPEQVEAATDALLAGVRELDRGLTMP